MKNTPEYDVQKKNRAALHGTLRGVVCVYLVFLAWQVVRGLPSSAMPEAVASAIQRYSSSPVACSAAPACGTSGSVMSVPGSTGVTGVGSSGTSGSGIGFSGGIYGTYRLLVTVK